MSSSSFPTLLYRASGLPTLLHAPHDIHLLCLMRFLRLFAYGTSYIILAAFLSSLAIPDARIGVFMTLTLLGDVVLSALLTLVTDALGRRRVLVAGALGMVGAGGWFAVGESWGGLVVASVLGVISPSGNEIGPFRAIEESILAHLTPSASRADIFAWYTLCGTSGAALGTLTSGFVVQRLQDRGWGDTASYRVVFVVYAVLGAIKAGVCLLLSRKVEMEREEAEYKPLEQRASVGKRGTSEDAAGLLSSEDEDEEGSGGERNTPKPSPPRPTLLQRLKSLLPPLSTVSRRILPPLLLLFSIDSFASGMASPSWVSYFFTVSHSLAPRFLGTLFLTTNIVAALSNLVALPLCRRIGPLKTMVFTHLPSALFLWGVPLPAPGKIGTPVAMMLLVARACTQTMDQAPRQAFLSMTVLKEERTAVLGIVNVAKTLAQAGGIGAAGGLVGLGGGNEKGAEGAKKMVPRKWWMMMFGGAGLLKASYDLSILWTFRSFKDREDQQAGPEEVDEEEAVELVSQKGGEDDGVDSDNRR